MEGKSPEEKKAFSAAEILTVTWNTKINSYKKTKTLVDEVATLGQVIKYERKR